MKKNTTPVFFLFLFLLLITNSLTAQVGIGTITPNASAALDVTSTTQGMLTPRMTTIQRNAIATPADGLIAYDTDLKSFYYYSTATNTWTRINSEANGRLNFKRIKSTDNLTTLLATELAAGGGTKYVLNSNTYYEINGTINFTLPVDLNNAYISGQDANEDVLVKTNAGNLFDGALGGTIRNVTITVNGGGKVFNLSGAATQTIIIRDSVIANSSNVGSITGFGLVFVSIVQYVGNTTGIIYDTISRLLISNAAWFSNNAGTYEKLQGTFSLVQKQGGFSEVTAVNAVGFDVSANPTITGDAVMETVVFSGTLASGGFYVKPYTVGTYAGFNFNNSWNVRCAGIPTETDAVATGNFYKTSSTTSTVTTATNQNQPYKVATTPVNLSRFESATTARLTYRGKKPRIFQATAALSFIESTNNNNATYVFYFVKVGTDGTTITALPETETFIDTNSGFIQSFPVSGTISLLANESVELYLKRINNGTKITMQVFSYNLSIK